jgi:hypothetical protein
MFGTTLALYMYLQDAPRCVRWTWTGDVYNRTVVCLEWRKKEPEKTEKKK